MSPIKIVSLILTMSYIKIVSLILQVLIGSVLHQCPPLVQPKWIQKVLSGVFTGITIILTFLGVSLYPAAEPLSPLVVAILLVAFSLVPPFAGLLESKYRSDGQSIYSTNRFPGHVLTNILGALTASGFVWVAHSTNGFDEFVARFPHGAAFNVMLPFAVFAVFYFVRWQQVDACPDIDEAVKHPGWEDKITGFSLRQCSQLINVLYLIAVAFVATTTFLYLAAYGMEQAKAGQPLSVSWQVIFTIVVFLLFLHFCGLRWSRQYRAVYLAFLTGTPAALVGVIIWLSWYRNDKFRNIAAVLIVGFSYVGYCVEAVFDSLAKNEKLHLIPTCVQD
jgi:hypothetical protein